MKRNGKAMTVLRIATGTAAVVFVGVYLQTTWGRVHAGVTSIHWGYLALSCVFFGTGYFVNGLVWKMLLSAGEKKAGFFDSLYMVCISMLMRYIPGKIWQLAGRFSMANARGFDRNTVVVSLVEETTADICGGIFIAYAAFGRQMGWAGLLLLAAIAAAAVVLSLKPARTRLRVPAVHGGRIAVAVVLYSVNWVGYGCAFYFTIRSLYAVDIPNIILCGGAMAVGWIGGMASFIIPNGIGVREGIVALLLSSVLSAPQAMAAALVFRLVSTLLELVFGGSLYYVNMLRSRRTNDRET
jgi:glycosyltransferase 2 family protein